MIGVKIYMEGGGDSNREKKPLREGMNGFLRKFRKKAADRRWRWQVVPCGSRRRTYEMFRDAHDRAKKGETVILLVDAEAPVTAPTSIEHLRTQPGSWNFPGVSERDVHLMVQVMETWIVADPTALAAYYGQGFRASALPSRPNLEEEDKADILSALERATQNISKATQSTSKGPYHKIRHAADLLKKISPTKVQKPLPPRQTPVLHPHHRPPITPCPPSPEICAVSWTTPSAAPAATADGTQGARHRPGIGHPARCRRGRSLERAPETNPAARRGHRPGAGELRGARP